MLVIERNGIAIERSTVTASVMPIASCSREQHFLRASGYRDGITGHGAANFFVGTRILRRIRTVGVTFTWKAAVVYASSAAKRGLGSMTGM
jgi:hypothetical protein